MNEKGITIFQIIALIFIVFVCFISFFIIKHFTNKEDITYVEYEKNNNPVILLNGDFTEFVSVGTEYEDKGVFAYSKSGKNISNYVTKKIYIDDHITTDIDTSKFRTYKITYTAIDPDNNSLVSTVSRIVIVTDKEAPKVSLPKTDTITEYEALSYDLTDGVVVSDNSGNVNIKNDNPLKNKAGRYIVTYKATDNYGNMTIRKRLIKVEKSMEIKEKNKKLIISFPNDNYTYKYSLDGGNNWIECVGTTTIDMNNVIVAKTLDGKIVEVLNYNI